MWTTGGTRGRRGSPGAHALAASWATTRTGRWWPTRSATVPPPWVEVVVAPTALAGWSCQPRTRGATCHPPGGADTTAAPRRRRGGGSQACVVVATTRTATSPLHGAAAQPPVLLPRLPTTVTCLHPGGAGATTLTLRRTCRHPGDGPLQPLLPTPTCPLHGDGLGSTATVTCHHPGSRRAMAVTAERICLHLAGLKPPAPPCWTAPAPAC